MQQKWKLSDTSNKMQAFAKPVANGERKTP
jgi:hypothetical protein